MVNKHYLNSYNLYNDFDERILENLTVKDGTFKKEFQSERYCPICLIEKPYKARHVKKPNLCVREFQFYSCIFDKLVFYKNTKIYLLICIFHILFLTLELTGLVSACKDEFTFFPVFYFIEFFLLSQPLHVKLLTAVNAFIFVSWLVDTILLFLSIHYGLTIDELMNPQYYPYLFQKTDKGHKYNNPNNKGFLSNMKALLTS